MSTSATAAIAGALDGGVATGANGAQAIGGLAYATGTGAIAMGNTGSFATSALASGMDSMALGNGTWASQESAVALGAAATASGSGSVAVGGAALASGLNAISIGGTTTGKGGAFNVASGASSISLGSQATASNASSIAIGTGAKATTANSVALGNGAATAAAVGTANGTIGGMTYYYAGTNPTGTVSVGAAGAERTITNVAAGQVSALSTNAVNGSELFATNTQVTANTNAISSLAGGITNINGRLADAVVYDSSAHSSLTLGGAGSSSPVALKNVAAGAVNASSTDAVDGAQLYGVTQSVTNVNNSITKIDNTLSTAGWGAQQNASSPTGYTYGGFITDANGAVSNPAVLYVPNTIGTANAHIVLDPGQGNSAYFVNGTRQDGHLPAGTVISNVANGIQDTDAANVGQVYDIVSQASGGGVDATPQVMHAALLGAPPSGSDVNTADLTTAYRTAAYYSQVAGLGDNTGSAPPSDVARATGAGSIAIGSNAYTPSTAGTSVGVQAYASASDAVALGSGSVANQANTVSVGNDGTSSYVAYDANGNAYTVQNAANTRRIVNLAAGEADTDAVNVSQLRSAASALGGGAGIDATGGFIAPAYSVGGTTVNSVGAAIVNLDNRVLKNAADIATLAAGDNGGTSGNSGMQGNAVTSTDADAVHFDSSDHSRVTLSSASGGNVGLTGLQNGALSSNSTDAVTGQQLYATNEQLVSLSNAVQNIDVSGSNALSINSTSGAAAATGTQSAAVGAGAVATGASSTAIGDKANATASNAVAIGANSIADRDNTVSVGAAGAERQIVNVAAGTSGTDAVNVNQLGAATAQSQAYTDTKVAGVQNQISTLRQDAFGAAAAAMAVAGLPQPTAPGKTMVAMGGSRLGGQTGMALGVSYVTRNNQWVGKLSVSSSSQGNTGVTMAAGYQW